MNADTLRSAIIEWQTTPDGESAARLALALGQCWVFGAWLPPELEDYLLPADSIGPALGEATRLLAERLGSLEEDTENESSLPLTTAHTSRAVVEAIGTDLSDPNNLLGVLSVQLDDFIQLRPWLREENTERLAGWRVRVGYHRAYAHLFPWWLGPI